MYPITQISLSLQEINFQGNIIPCSWKNHLKLNNRVDLNSMYILSEIIFWYRPVILRDEFGQDKYFQKFKSDLLQKSYSQLESSLGLTKKQIQDSLDRLEKLGLVKRHFRTIHVQVPSTTDFRALNNVMYIEIFIEKVKEITYSDLKKVIPSSPAGKEGSTYKSIGVSPEVVTYTETTSKITTNNNIVCSESPVANAHLKNSVVISHPSGTQQSITIDDIYILAVQKREKWTVDEIQKIWNILLNYKSDIRDLYLFIKGTIKNLLMKEKSEQINHTKNTKKQNVKKIQNVSKKQDHSSENEDKLHERYIAPERLNKKGNLYNYKY